MVKLVKQVRHKQAGKILLEKIVELAPDAILVTDRQGKIVLANAQAERLFGYSRRKLLAISIEDLMPRRFRNAHAKHRADYQSAPYSRPMGTGTDLWAQHEDGTEFEVDISVSPIEDEDGVLVVTILRDLSKHNRIHQQLHDSEDRFKKIFEYSNDAILVIDPDQNHIVDVNLRACTLLGFTRDEMLSMSLADIHPRDIPRLLAFAESVKGQGGGWTNELSCLTKSGDILPSEVSASMIVHNGQPRMIAMVRDITERKELERMKDAFISNVTHELRTPLTSLKLSQQLLRRVPPDKHNYIVQRIGRETERLGLIIESLLLLSRLDQQQAGLNLETADLNELVRQLVDDRASLAESQGLHLTFAGQSSLPPVRMDQGLLEQVLSILLTNAINYTPVGGTLEVRTHAQKENGKRWVGFSVSDSGPGISPDEQEKLFQRFYRGEVGRESGAPGTGLGLAIAKEIVEKHAGRIAVESEGVPGRGATFSVWLPAEGRKHG